MILSYLQYIIIAIIFIIFTKINTEKIFIVNTYKSNILWLVEWLFFTILASARQVFDIYGGADAQNYIDCFLFGYEYSGEKLFYLFGKMIRLFTSNYHVYFFFIYGIIVAAILSFIEIVLCEDNKSCSVAILFLMFNMYITSFGVMRQWLGISISMLSIVAIKKKHNLLGVAVMLIAGFIHFTLLPLFLVLVGYFVLINVHNKISVGNMYVIPKCMFQIGLMCNVVSFCLAAIFISIVSKTEYAAYVNADLLANVSWLGYIPTILAVALMVYYEKFYNKNTFNGIMVFFLLAHFATFYIMIGLGMSRFMLCFFPIRVWGIKQLEQVFCRKLTLGYKSVTVWFQFEIAVLADGAIYMWRTIENGALPIILAL